MTKKKKKKDPVIIALDIVIIILIFVMIANAVSFVFYKKIADEVSFTSDADMMSFELENADYGALIQGRYINEINGETQAGEYHALAEYIEAASLYRVYEAKNYTDRARQQEQIMAKAREEMGELTVFADKADKMFTKK